MNNKIILFILLMFFVSCAEEDSTTEDIEKRVEISSFLIEENTMSGVKTKTNLEVEGYDSFSFEDHGLFIHHNGSLIKKIEQGQLSKNSFESIIRSGVVKGNNYSVFPYAFIENKFIYGDTLDFISNVDIKIKVKEIKPLNGFVYDTISIIGENFCKSLPDSRTQIILNNSFQNVIYESDSLIKAIITPYINSSKLTPTIRNCGVDTILPVIFKINKPILDSIASKETYVGENTFVFGENFHSQISNIWLNDIEAPLNKQRLDINKLEFTIPEGLPAGLLNLKIKVLDTIIEKQEYYKSTSPIITSLNKRDTGFLDTLTIKGSYLKQKNLPTQVFVGDRKQRIISLNKEEIKVVIDAYFSTTNPKLVVKAGSFELEENINMLPPEIISFDKEKYHLDDDFVTIKTKYFIAGSSSSITMGESSLRDYNSFVNVDEYGTISLPTKSWLEAGTLYPNFLFSGIGMLNIEIKTQFGTNTKPINIFNPKIQSINNSSFFIDTHTDYIELSGLDFGYRRVSEIYIDDEAIQDPGSSAYTLYNKQSRFQIPKNISPGNHILRVLTGGQFSNEIAFNVKEITTSGITQNSGIRELDLFTINGNNLENKYSYVIKVNGARCNHINNSKNQVQFTLPYYNPLEDNMPVTIEYGEQIINVGTINGIEPYSKLEDYQVPNDYYNTSSYFEFKDELYFLNINGIYRFDVSSGDWVKIESNMPFSNYSDSNGKNHISEVGNTIYVPYGNTFYPYNMIEKQWKTPIEISLEESHRIVYGIITNDNYAYILEGLSLSGSTSFIKYNLQNHTKETLSQPPYNIGASGLGDVLYYSDEKIYLDPRQENIVVYDLKTNSWEDIGFPRAYKFFYDNNLYVHNNVLYFSGGQGNSGLEFNLYAYDLSTKVWTLKTPVLLKLGKHAVWGNGNSLYFGLGSRTYISSDNKEMIKYNINEDPR